MNQNGNRFKKISYNYDLISGKVNSVAYQRGWSDQFFHRYSYDGENRLTLVETSLDGKIWEKDARYEYYLHGPLARAVLGQQQVQGIDYAYTLQGWLKGVNSSGATSLFDIGRDGNYGNDSTNRYVARDAYGFSLNYFGDDYKAARNGVTPFPAYSAYLNADFRPLYNGNISSMVSTNRIFSNPVTHPDSASLLFNYSYDQLNRITGMDVYNKFNREQNGFAQLNRLDKFKERVSYDPNGNILKYLRNGNGNGNPAHLRMDSLQYAYYPGTNRLRQVRDSVPASWYGAAAGDKIIDIDNQADEDNYLYDSIGNLIRDKAEGINNINWNVYGKIVEISRSAGTHVPASEIRYTYDAAGNRISKTVEKNGRKNITWYVRDAQGNVMSTYSADSTAVTPLAGFVLNADERYIYGSSRLGVVTASTEVDNGNGGPEKRLVDTGGVFKRGERIYELSNHLGNVLVTISDRKKGIADPLNAALIKFFEPVMLSGIDYYPFGMAMRIGGDSSYRYGFNGKENDNEVKGGDGLQQDYGMRVYDSRLGRFLSVDPLSSKFASLTPYQYAGNKPILCLDLDGLEELPYTEKNQYGEKQIWNKIIKSPNGRFQTRQSNIPDGATPVTQNMTDKEVYRFTVARVLSPGSSKIADNQYLDEKYFEAEERVKYYFSHHATATMAEGSQSEKLTSEIHTIVVNGLFSDDEVTSDASVTMIERRTSFFGKFNWGKTAIELGAGALVSNMLKGAASRFASMANGEVRIWYNQQLSKLNLKVPFTEANAAALSAERNTLKATARLMMKDRKAAAALDKSDPIRPFQYYVDKYTEQGYSGEELWKKIITGSAKPNAEVNKRFNIK